ncbi:AraC family transcriptional regulator [Vallitalea guaymasensis]|uniref:AraC family transcriptional regulator n=1 Tax=Vallitalea guaymasensis TaxID=1185412 RepID=UPI00272A68CA|nr:AraC family transcriptional regulator [Vallitalea guaymasensis]
MQRDIIPINEKGMEILEYVAEDFPCAIFFADIAKYALGSVPWHWHEEIEIFVVTKGCLRMLLGSQEYIVNENEGAFVNSNILHSMEVAEGEGCELITILFSPSIFTGGKGTSLYHQMTTLIFDNAELATYIFCNTSTWKNEIILAIKDIYSAFNKELFCKELIICENLSRIWRFILNDIMYKNLKSVPINPLQESRTQHMMQFIHDNYSEPLSIKEIADFANISTRECSRCFQNIIHTPPVKYLMKYRISVSLSLLLTTNYSMTQIAEMIGFNSSSYFSKVFNEHMNMSPTDYRKLHLLKKE